MKKIFSKIILLIIVHEYKLIGGNTSTNTTQNQTPNNRANYFQTNQVQQINTSQTNPQIIHQQILRERNQNNQYRLDDDIMEHQFSQQLGVTKMMTMDQIRDKLKNMKFMKPFTNPNQPVRGVHSVEMVKGPVKVQQEDKQVRAVNKEVLKQMLNNQMKFFMDPASNLARQELQFSSVVKQIRGFTMYLQQIIEKHIDELDLKMVGDFEKIIFQLAPVCDNMYVYKEKTNDKLHFEYRFFQSSVVELRQELERQLQLLTEKCYYQPQHFLCKLGYKNKLTDFTVMSDSLKPIEKKPNQKTRFDVLYLRETIQKKDIPALAAFYNYFGHYSIYDLTESIRSSKLRYMLIDMFNLIEISESKKVVTSQFITAIQNCFSMNAIHLNLIPLGDTLDSLRVQYSYLKENIIKFIFDLRTIEKLLTTKTSTLELDFKIQSQKIINYLSELESNNTYYIDVTDIIINNKNLDDNPYDNVDKQENRKIHYFMQKLTKMQNSKLYPMFQQLEQLLNNLDKDQNNHEAFERKLKNLIEIISHTFGSDNVEIQTSKNKQKVYNIYEEPCFVSFTLALNDMDSFYFTKNEHGENPKAPYLHTLRPILDQLLLITGNMRSKEGKMIEKIKDEKQVVRRRIVVLDILECGDCVKKNYTKNFKNQIK